VNDSRFVGMSIYNVVVSICSKRWMKWIMQVWFVDLSQVLCIITAPVTLIIGSHQDASFAFVAVAILLSSFLAMGLIFVPKVIKSFHVLGYVTF
jgi:gamma-aminobutyric acid type B receptor